MHAPTSLVSSLELHAPNHAPGGKAVPCLAASSRPGRQILRGQAGPPSPGRSSSPMRCWLPASTRSAAMRTRSGRCASDSPLAWDVCTSCEPRGEPPRPPARRAPRLCPAPMRKWSCRSEGAGTRARRRRTNVVMNVDVDETETGGIAGAAARGPAHGPLRRVRAIFAEPPRAPPGHGPSGMPRINLTWC